MSALTKKIKSYMELFVIRMEWSRELAAPMSLQASSMAFFTSASHSQGFE